VSLSTPRPKGRDSPFDKLKAPSTAEGLEVHPEPEFSISYLRNLFLIPACGGQGVKSEIVDFMAISYFLLDRERGFS
jgi:hypothetical protein